MVRDKNWLVMHDHLQRHIRKLESFFTKRPIKINSTKSLAFIFTHNSSTPKPLSLDGSFISFGREVKNIGVFLDSTLIWRKHNDYTVKKFYKAENDLAHILYSNEMSVSNKIQDCALLNKTELCPILLYCAQF